MLKKADQYLKYLPLVYSTFVIWGYVFISVYYSKFDIEIAPYLEISEIVLLLNNDIVELLALTFTGLYFTFCYRYISLCIILRILNPLLKKIRMKNIYHFGIWAYSPLFIYALVKNYDCPGEFLILITSGMLFISIFSFRFKRYPFPRLKNTLPLFVLGTVLMIAGSWQYSLDKAKTTYNSKSTKEIIFKSSNDTIRTGDNYKFIGQTRKYIFILDSLTNKSTVYNRADIISITSKIPKSRKELKLEKLKNRNGS